MCGTCQTPGFRGTLVVLPQGFMFCDILCSVRDWKKREAKQRRVEIKI